MLQKDRMQVKGSHRLSIMDGMNSKKTEKLRDFVRWMGLTWA